MEALIWSAIAGALIIVAFSEWIAPFLRRKSYTMGFKDGMRTPTPDDSGFPLFYSDDYWRGFNHGTHARLGAHYVNDRGNW